MTIEEFKAWLIERSADLHARNREIHVQTSDHRSSVSFGPALDHLKKEVTINSAKAEAYAEVLRKIGGGLI